MRLRNIKKTVAENYFIFPQEMYTSLAGSIVVTSYIFSEDKPDVIELKKKWKYFTRHGFDFSFSDENYIQKVCDAFGVQMFPLDCAAYVQSEYNCLIAPYVEIEGEKQLLPLREDGWYSRTLRKGKIYPLSEKIEKAV